MSMRWLLAIVAAVAAVPQTLTTGAGQVTKEPDLTGYTSGASVQLAATPEAGWVFSGWSGEGCSGVDECVVTVDRLRTVTASFTALPATYPLTVQKQGDGSGLVALTEGNGNHSVQYSPDRIADVG